MSPSDEELPRNVQSVFTQEEQESFPDLEEASYLPKVGDHIAVFATKDKKVETIWFAVVEAIPASWHEDR